tara:strand:- start:280 stop:1911 length:1632 start_codon:yes stop_codon:yes gene_type:complete
MAKKTTSYSPNLSLIQGEALVRGAEAMAADIKGQSFTKGFLGALEAGMEEKRQRENKMAAYMADLGNIANISKLEDGYNKQEVTDFLRNGRDEYARAADCYEKTKDIECLDKMNAIKTSFSNLNSQLENFTNEKKEYLTAFDQQQIAHGNSYDYYLYDNMFTNSSKFNIEENGDIAFGGVSGDFQKPESYYHKYNDISGKWNVKNNVAEKYILERNSAAITNGEKGFNFYADDVRRSYRQSFKNTGPEGIQVLAGTDITGDDEYMLDDGTIAGNLSFEQMWANGSLDDKFYKKRNVKDGVDWMYDDANVDEVNGLLAEYYTDVEEYSWREGNANYTPPRDGGDGDGRGSTAFVDISGSFSYVGMNAAKNAAINMQNKMSYSRKVGGVELRYEWNPESMMYDEIGRGEGGDFTNKIRSIGWDEAFSDRGFANYFPEMLGSVESKKSREIDPIFTKGFDFSAGGGEQNLFTSEIFSKNAEGVLDLNSFLEATKGVAAQVSQNNTVTLTPKDSEEPKLILNFGIKDKSKQKQQLQDMNNFVKQYSN